MMTIFSHISNLIINRVNRFTLFILALLFTINTSSQNNNNEQIKRTQRSIFIFNFAQQIQWKNNKDIDLFKIGVLGNDRAFIDLKGIAQKRKIQNKTINVKRFNTVSEIQDIQLLYVNKKLNFDINHILNIISGKNILLVSEDYNFHASMINMVSVGDSFEYEINSELLKKEKFKVVNTLKASAISNSQKWKNLYQKTEESLNVSKIENKKKEALIKNKEKELKLQEEKIDTFKQRVTQQSEWINELGDINKLQQKKYDEKLAIESKLSETIQSQIKHLNKQKADIELSHLKIEEQRLFLENQNLEIADNKLTLQEKDDKIKRQKSVNILLGLLALLTIIGLFLIYKNFLTKKKLALALEDKNKIIEENTNLMNEKNKELEQFAYIASHDLKEPLVTISGLISLFQEDYINLVDDTGKKTLEYIHSASERMKKLIDALLEYSRLGQTKKHVQVNCSTLLNNIKSDLANVIKRTQTTINIQKLPNVTGSQIELGLLFQNLISNSIKFIKPNVKPIIYIDCKEIMNSKNKSFWEFSIKDNGIGIAKKHQDRIFAIFQRLHTREEYEGTGIGLAHCKRIVDAHKGTIRLESKLDEGTTFYVSIPKA